MEMNFNKELLNSIAVKIWNWIINHPFASVFILMCFFIGIMVLSHVSDIAEGNARHFILWAFFIIFLATAIVIFLFALQEGVINIPFIN